MKCFWLTHWSHFYNIVIIPKIHLKYIFLGENIFCIVFSFFLLFKTVFGIFPSKVNVVSQDTCWGCSDLLLSGLETKPFHYHIKYQAKSISLESFLCMHACVGVWELYIHVEAEANLRCCSSELSYNGF